MVKISIGMPVYNGAEYVEQAIASILNQTFSDFTINVFDNDSADETEAIVKRLMLRDTRISYFKNEKNIGAAENFNLAFRQSQCQYFKWAAHDDVLSPEYLQCCVDVLDKRPEVVLCHTAATIIDSHGDFKKHYQNTPLHSDSDSVAVRFSGYASSRHECLDVFGVIRANVLDQTGLIGAYFASDRVLLAELAIRGKLVILPQLLFFSRDHPKRSIQIPVRERVRNWWSSSEQKNRKFIFPYWQMMTGYYRAIYRASSSWRVRLICCKEMLIWSRDHWRHLGADIRFALIEFMSRQKSKHAVAKDTQL